MYPDLMGAADLHFLVVVKMRLKAGESMADRTLVSSTVMYYEDVFPDYIYRLMYEFIDTQFSGTGQNDLCE
ncbi:hypothetical protein MNBD_GAMMA25-604 [hydrothermal vent metagenome]|uniref:Uncharacterized protein n=1 Tax=hydrothermal vent metagenome TaxID=652676 RepID=A0A3B1AIU5_9ZZZZ